MARTALIGGNNAEALAYYNRVLEVDPEWSEAWLGKGKAAEWQSTLANFRFGEMLIAFNHAIAAASDGEKPMVIAEAVEEVNRLVSTLYGMARDHMAEYVALDSSWPTYLVQVSEMLEILESARQWSPDSRVTLDNIVHLCKDNIEGFSYRDPYNNNAPGLHGITPAYEQLLKTRMDQAIAGLRAIDPSYSAPLIQKKTADACFVVTATLGDFDHPDVTLLRRFRDVWLSERSWGRLAVRAYYRVGPLLADAIRDRPILRRWSRRLLVLPAAAFARKRLD